MRARLSKTKFIQLRDRNQITIPAEVAEALDLKPGRFLGVSVTEEGWVRLQPAHIATMGTPEAERAEAEADVDILSGRYETYESGAALAEELKRRVATTGRARPQAESSGAPVLPSVYALLTLGKKVGTVSVLQHGLPVCTRELSPLGKHKRSAGLLKEVEETFRAYGAHHGESPIEMIYVAEELRPDIMQRLREHFQVPLAVVGPPGKLSP